MNLQDKVAVVTGGSRGIGRAICQKLASLGALVVVNYVSRSDAAEETVASIKNNGGNAVIAKFNVADSDDVQASLDTALGDL